MLQNPLAASLRLAASLAALLLTGAGTSGGWRGACCCARCGCCRWHCVNFCLKSINGSSSSSPSRLWLQQFLALFNFGCRLVFATTHNTHTHRQIHRHTHVRIINSYVLCQRLRLGLVNGNFFQSEPIKLSVKFSS